MKHTRFPWIVTIVLFLSLCGCTTQAEQSDPEDALFCENIADQVQSIDQLHVATETLQTQTTYQPCNYDTIYAMWFSVTDYADTLRGKSEAEFREIMGERFQNAADMGINTVYLHVHAYLDAYYESDLFPMGAYADPDITFDPLEVMLEEAHARNLSVHAWINPLRGPSTKAMEEMDKKYLVKQWYDDAETNGTYFVESGGYWWLNPAYTEVRQLITDGVTEIATRYAIDGIHLDDYFYPTTDEAFDAAAFAASGESDLSTFRLEQTNQMVQQIYEAVKSIHENLLVSISPQGTMSGNYESQFADVRRWGSESGYCDVLIPQVYYGFFNETAPFEETVSLWTQTVTEPGVALVIGICTYKLGNEDTWAGSGSQEWIENTKIPQQQVEFLQETDDIHGIAIYDYDATFCPETAADAMAEAVEEIGDLLRQ